MYLMLGDIYERGGNAAAAIRVYKAAAENEKLPQQVRSSFSARLQQLMSR